LTVEHATFGERELRATVLERAPGELGPDEALALASEMLDDGRVLALANGRFTTREMRTLERTISDRLVKMGSDQTPDVSEQVRDSAIASVEERLGSALSDEQRSAVAQLTGPRRAAVLIGRAGTGKGVVLDAVAQAERDSGRGVTGVALAGATAERLGDSAPALAGRTTTVDALLARGVPPATIIVDEAGMLDTRRLAALSAAVEQANGKLILVGDDAQLPAIDAGGMLNELKGRSPTATLTENRRAIDPRNAEAWDAPRDGDAAFAMDHYRSRGALHLSDTRDAALEAAVQRWDSLRTEVGAEHIALMSDGSSHEIERLNARAQHLRFEHGELSDREIPIPAGDLPTAPYTLRTGDRVTWRASQQIPGERRVENGARGVLVEANAEAGAIRVRLDATGREVDVAGNDVADLRLAYAQHVYRQQGATVEYAIAVTGGWQTSRESAYVEASRARRGIDWYVARDDLGADDSEAARVDRLAAAMTRSVAKTPSLAEPLTDPARELAGALPGHEVASLAPMREVDADAAIEVAPGIE
jgi:ATP-dependent exoDNAse (exonuclease V) alpha subunit